MTARLVTQLDRWAIIVSGSREWTDHAAIRHRMIGYPPGTIVLHGDAPGADSMADSIARDLRMRAVAHPYFSEHNKAGGAVRNALLVQLLTVYQKFGYRTAVEAFKLNGAKNIGTSNLCVAAAKAGFVPNVTGGGP